MAEGPLGILDRPTTLGPLVKKDLEEAIPEEIELLTQFEDIDSSLPSWAKDKDMIAKRVMSNRQSELRELIRISKRERKEVTIPITLNRKTSKIMFNEPHVGQERGANPLEAESISDPLALENTIVGSIHTHPGYQTGIEEETERERGLLGVHMPSIEDVNGVVFKTSAGYSISGGISGVIAAGGNRDGQGSVWALYNRETMRLAAAFDEDISEEAMFAAYNIFVSEFTDSIEV